MPENRQFRVVQREEIAREAWDAFVDASDQAWLWHRFDLQDAVSTWYGKSDISFAVLDTSQDDRLVLVAPLQLVEGKALGFFRWNMLDSLGGFACANDLGKSHAVKVQGFAREHLLARAGELHAVSIRFSLTTVAPAYRGERCPRVNPLLDLGFENKLSQTYLIDLRGSNEALWDNLEGNCRTRIRKARKEGIVIREADSFADIEEYYDMHCETYHRTGTHPHPFAYFEHIWHNFVVKGFARIFLAEYEGKVIAADNEAMYKNAVLGWTAAGRTMKTMGVNNLLHWHAIEFAKKNGYEWYDSGEAFPAAREGKNKGLNDFKRSFGGELYPFYKGEITCRPRLVRLYDAFDAVLRGR